MTNFFNFKSRDHYNNLLFTYWPFCFGICLFHVIYLTILFCNKHFFFYDYDFTLCSIFLFVYFFFEMILYWCKEFVSYRYEFFSGKYTKNLRAALLYGFLLFLVLEAMLFGSIFWAYFDRIFHLSYVTGFLSVPTTVEMIRWYKEPLYATLVLLAFGWTCNSAYYFFQIKNTLSLKKAYFISFLINLLGCIFLYIQYIEYHHLHFTIFDFTIFDFKIFDFKIFDYTLYSLVFLIIYFIIEIILAWCKKIVSVRDDFFLDQFTNQLIASVLYGFLLFFLSEAMLFGSIFWASLDRIFHLSYVTGFLSIATTVEIMKWFKMFFFFIIFVAFFIFFLSVYNYNKKWFFNVVFLIFFILFINYTIFLHIYYQNKIYHFNISFMLVFFIFNFIFILNSYWIEDIYARIYFLLYFNFYFLMFIKSVFYYIYSSNCDFYFNLDVLLLYKQELFHLETCTFNGLKWNSSVFNQKFDFTRVFTKKNDFNDNGLSLIEKNSSSSHNTSSGVRKNHFIETQVSEFSKNSNSKAKALEDKIVTANHIASLYSKETRDCLYCIPSQKSEARIPSDLDIIHPNLNLEMHEFKHIQQVPSLLKLINYSIYYSHVTKLSFLHTIEHIPHKLNLEKINNEFILDLYRSILDQDLEMVHNQLKQSCGEYLKKSRVDLKNDFNINLTKYGITTTDRNQQIDELIKNEYFLMELYKNFNSFINSIDFTNRDKVNEEIYRSIYLTTLDEYKSSFFNRKINLKFTTVFDNFFIENNKTFHEPFHPDSGLYSYKGSNIVLENLTNSVLDKKVLNYHFDPLCINSKNFNNHHLGIQFFKKFLYLK